MFVLIQPQTAKVLTKSAKKLPRSNKIEQDQKKDQQDKTAGATTKHETGNVRPKIFQKIKIVISFGFYVDQLLDPFGRHFFFSQHFTTPTNCYFATNIQRNTCFKILFLSF